MKPSLFSNPSCRFIRPLLGTASAPSSSTFASIPILRPAVAFPSSPYWLRISRSLQRLSSGEEGVRTTNKSPSLAVQTSFCDVTSCPPVNPRCLLGLLSSPPLAPIWPCLASAALQMLMICQSALLFLILSPSLYSHGPNH